MGDQTPKLQSNALQLTPTYDRKQRQKMVLAVALLLVAMGIFVIRDWHTLFGPADTSATDWDSDSDGGSRPSSHRKAPVAVTPPAKSKAPVTAASHPAEAPPAPPAVVKRQALPPLEVEVLAGNSDRAVAAGNNSVRVDTGSDSAASNAAPLGASVQATSNAAEHVKMSVDTSHVLERPVQPSYPMLARQMKVQGAVILQALIGTDGAIQDLKVLSGPSILASAAQEAVRQWRFKPYLQNGVPVETEAKITVNFTISTL